MSDSPTTSAHIESDWAGAIVDADNALADRGNAPTWVCDWQLRNDNANRAAAGREVTVRLGGRYATGVMRVPRPCRTLSDLRAAGRNSLSTIAPHADGWTWRLSRMHRRLIGAWFVAPMSGGSPYADRGTGWHADGCLCRTCNS